MKKAKIEKLLDNLTLGLNADPEIRLDVKSELRSHLDEKIKEGITMGLSEKESEKQALKSFGDTIQISDGIADANIAKMSLKARLKVFGGILLIPAVIICALISFDPAKTQLILSSYQMGRIMEDELITGYRPGDKIFYFFDKYTPEEKFILYGDESKDSMLERQKAIWEHFPESKVYMANYIINLLAERESFPNRQKIHGDWQAKMNAALEIAKQKDPDNALYNYITAGLLFKKACETIRIDIKPKNKNEKIKYKWSIKIKDRKLMDKAIEEYLKGTQKKYLKTYITDIVNKRLDIMGRPQNFLFNIRQIAMKASIILPHLSDRRNIARVSSLYAALLLKEGKQQEALKIIAPWKTYIKQITSDSNHLIGFLVDSAVAKIYEQEVPDIYRKAGKIKLADSVKQELQNINLPVKRWKDDVRKYHIGEQHIVKAGILAEMMLPVLGKMDYTEKDFAVSNKIEYTAVEKTGIIFLNFLFLILMIGGLLTALYWRMRSGQKALLLAPSAKLIGKIFLLGILLPLTIYILISISGIFGGHEYNIGTNFIPLGAQFIMLLTLIPTIIFILTQKHVHQRCIELNISCPKIKKNKILKIMAIIAFVVFFIFAISPWSYPSLISLTMTPAKSMLSITLTEPLIIITLINVGIVVLYIIILFAKYLRTLFSGKQYALYYGAFAKSLTPIFALAMIFMTLIIIPYLSWREADLISKDKILYGNKLSASITVVEDKVTQRLKREMLKALE